MLKQLAINSFRSAPAGALLLAFLLLTASAQAEVFYKWKSDDGVWEYGAHPPPGIEAIEIKTTSTKASDAAAKAEPATTSSAGGTLVVEETEAKRAKSAKNAEYCATASANLEALSSKAVIRRRDDEGNITTISEKERQEEIDKAELAIERYCN
ncbi:MAG: DUF4124 domain-containing protein [Pseudomonadales bacterium]